MATFYGRLFIQVFANISDMSIYLCIISGGDNITVITVINVSEHHIRSQLHILDEGRI